MISPVLRLRDVSDWVHVEMHCGTVLGTNESGPVFCGDLKEVTVF